MFPSIGHSPLNFRLNMMHFENDCCYVHVHSLETFPISCAMRITSHLPKNAFHPRCIVWIKDSLSYFFPLQLPFYRPPLPPVDIQSCTYTRTKYSHTHPDFPINILRIKRFIVTQTVTEAHIVWKTTPQFSSLHLMVRWNTEFHFAHCM